MKVVSLITGTNNPFDIPREFAKHLIKLGEVREWTPEDEQREIEKKNPPPEHKLTWACERFKFDNRPYIACYCPGCLPNVGTAVGSARPAYTFEGHDISKAIFRHLGVSISPPAEIVERYTKLVAAYYDVPKADLTPAPVRVQL